MKKNKNKGGIVYSTDPFFSLDEEKEDSENITLEQQKLKLKLDTKHRAGKAVTIIDGFIGTENDLESLGKKLKNYCGTGGTVKDGQILIQGDHREKIFQWLVKNGFTNSKSI